MIDLNLFFRYLKGRWQPILWKNGKLLNFVALAFKNEIGYHYLNVRINGANDASISSENFVKFRPVTPEITQLINFVNVRYDTAKK